MRKIIFYFLYCLLPMIGRSQWTLKNPFQQKDFIKNNGQWQDKIAPGILYGAHIDGVCYFFTKNGFLISKTERHPLLEKDEESEKGKIRTAEEERREHTFTRKEKKCSVEWLGANTEAVVAEEEKANYYVFSEGEKHTSTRTSAYKKLIYKNIYPFTDLVFEFPENKNGLKYSFYLHPGADPTRIKYHVKGKEKIKLNSSGDLVISSELGDITDHKPLTYRLSDNKEIESSFTLSNHKVGFALSELSPNETIVIDPWLTTPPSSMDYVVDVDYDNNGNTYASGNDPSTFGFGIPLIKINSAGNIVWTYVASNLPAYGDFAIDRTGHRIYMVGGVVGGGIEKIGMDGALVASNYNLSPMDEFYRICFSSCTHQAVVAGGSTQGAYQAFTLDTTLQNLNPVNAFTGISEGFHDVVFLSIDNFSNVYMLPAKSEYGQVTTTPYDNAIIKMPLPALSPNIYVSSTGYHFNEINSVSYGFYPMSSWYTNSFNGITPSNNIIYTWDSYAIKKWDGPTGANLGSKTINAVPYSNVTFTNDSTFVYWGGITSDDCGNVFAGSQDSILQFDANLNRVGAFKAADTVLDVRLGSGNTLYVCGYNFISMGSVNLPACNAQFLNITSTTIDAGCSGAGSCTLSVSGGTPPYTVTWSTTPPQTGTVVTNLPAGTYMATVKDNSCQQVTQVYTVSIGAAPGGFTSVASTHDVKCHGDSTGSIAMTTNGGVAPFTFNWSNGQQGAGLDSIGSLHAGTYSVLITDNNGCLNNATVIITQPSAIVYGSSSTTICSGDTTSITISPSGGTPSYTVTWTNSTVIGNSIHGVGAGIYGGTIKDSIGCTAAFSYTLVASPSLSGSASHAFNCNVVNSGTVTVNATGGVAPYLYSWTGFPGNTQSSLSNISAGIYTVTVTDSNNCKKSFVDTVPSYSPITISMSSVKPCNISNGSIVANASGGIAGVPIQYSWTGVSATTNSVSGLGLGTYTVTVSSGTCVKSQTITLTQAPVVDSLQITGTYCQGDDAVTLNAYVGTGIDQPYQWYNGSTSIPNANSSSCVAPVANASLYSVTWSHNGCRYKSTAQAITELQNLLKTIYTNIFTPNADTVNQVFYPFVVGPGTLSQSVESYSLVIYTRWGEKVFETNSLSKGWDGKTSDSKDAPDGTYYWVMEMQNDCVKNKAGAVKGFLQLIR